MRAGTGGVEDLAHFGGFVEQGVLACECCMHPACDVQPLLARFGGEAPSEQMVFWRGPLGVETDSTSR